MPSPVRDIRVAFIMEQHLGLGTYYRNLRAAIDECKGTASDWIRVTYREGNLPWERVSILPSRVRATLTAAWQVRRNLARRSYDALFFSTQVPAVFALDRVKRTPTIVATDITPIQYDAMAAQYGHQADQPGPVRWLKRQINRDVFRSSARLLPWSTWAGRSLQADYGVPRDRIEVLPIGVDLSFWRPRSDERRLGPPRILFVGGDFVRKGGRQLLEAVAALGPDRAELHLVTRDALEPAPGIVIHRDLQPNTPELRDLYTQADLFVLPSLAEAFGIAAVEAQAVGLPAIVSDSGGLPDTVADGETGYIVPAGDSTALACALDILLADQDRRHQMGVAARRRAEAVFDMRKGGARVLELLRQIAR